MACVVCSCCATSPYTEMCRVREGLREAGRHCVSYLPGGRITFREQGEGELYGNDVILRQTHLESLSNRSWIDIDDPLPAGVIERFYIYVHNVNVTQLDPQSRRIRLQVWRQVDVTLKTYQLVWLQLITVSAGYPNGALYSVSSHVNLLVIVSHQI